MEVHPDLVKPQPRIIDNISQEFIAQLITLFWFGKGYLGVAYKQQMKILHFMKQLRTIN